MKVYKVTYRLFNFPYVIAETQQANVRADNETHAIEKLKKALKVNGHRLNRVIDVEVTNNPNGVMSDTQNGKEV